MHLIGTLQLGISDLFSSKLLLVMRSLIGCGRTLNLESLSAETLDQKEILFLNGFQEHKPDNFLVKSIIYKQMSCLLVESRGSKIL